jgi:hypothetical protein
MPDIDMGLRKDSGHGRQLTPPHDGRFGRHKPRHRFHGLAIGGPFEKEHLSSF